MGIFKKFLLLIIFCLFLVPLQSVHASPPANFQKSLIIGSGLDGPAGFGIAPDGRIFILQRSGEVKIYKNGQLLSQNFAALPTAASGDRGLIGIAFDPDFLNNHWVYFYYTSNENLHNYLVRFDASGDIGTNGPIILYQTQDQSFQLHVGGTIRFGPDGKIYISIGDNGYSANSQDLSNPHGKILRLNSDGTIPLDNPFVNSSSLPEIYAYGFRNPFRFSFDSATGAMYEGDVGEATWEEINLVVPGKNYGWPNCEGLCSPTQSQFTDPIYTYNHNGGSAAIMVGPVYHGQMFPSAYQGKLFFGDYALGFIKTINTNGSSVQNFDSSAGSVVDMQLDPKDGSLYYINYYPGQLYKVTYSTGVQVPSANATADKVKGISPLSINFSSQGSSDPNGLSLTYNWDFGDGTSSTAANPNKIYNNNGRYTVQLTVSNGTYSALANPIVVQVGIAPTVTIGQPTNGTTYKAGDSFTVTASAVDGAGFDISDGSLSTTILFHHQTHIHPFLGPLIGRTHTFTIPNTGEVSADTYYEIDVTATDTNGLSTTATTNVYPIKSNLTFTNSVSNNPVAGLEVLLDGIPTDTPQTIQGVVNFLRLISVNLFQTINGVTYTFDHWSDNGSPAHYISTQSTDTTYTAFFRTTTPYTGQYYNNKNLSGSPVLTRQDPDINFDWGTNSPDPKISQSNFSVRWTKSETYIAGTYAFTTSTDDGVRLYIDGTPVIDQWHDQGETSYTANVDLTAGKHTLIMEYYQSGGGALAALQINPVSGPAPTILPSPTPSPTSTPSPTPSPSSTPNPSSTPIPPTKLGGLNLSGYCASLGQSVDLEAGIWKCQPSGNAIDISKACQWQYNNPTAVGIQADPNNPYTWQCFTSSPTPSPTPIPSPSPTPTPSPIPSATPNPTATPTPSPSPSPSNSPSPVQLGGLNLQGYCKSTGQTGVNLTAGIWNCTPSNKAISMNLACQWQYNNPSAFGQEMDPNNPYTWQCFSSSSNPSPSPSPSASPTPIPTPSPTPIGTFTGQYFKNQTLSGTPTLTRQDPAINFDWGTGSPDPKIPNDHFSVRWTKTQQFTAGTYNFHLESDDGIRMWIDSKQIFTDWTDHAVRTYDPQVTLTTGNHTIKVEYYENTGSSKVIFQQL